MKIKCFFLLITFFLGIMLAATSCSEIDEMDDSETGGPKPPALSKEANIDLPLHVGDSIIKSPNNVAID